MLADEEADDFDLAQAISRNLTVAMVAIVDSSLPHVTPYRYFEEA